jgi:hypothetical protein
VKLAAEQLIRKGGASRLFMWLDSQDIAAVDKSILKSPGLWIMGIQREANEVKRVLAHVSGRKKPAPDQVMDLSRGEFYACWSGNMRHVYVQPAWMDAEAARQIATGERPRSSVPAPVAFHRADTEPILPAEPDEEPDEEEEMDAKEIAREVARELRALLPDWREAIGCAPAEPGSVPPEEAVARNRGHFDEEALYQRFKARLAHEAPTLLRVLLQQSEIEVEVQRHTIKVDGDSLRGRIARLIKAGFFESPKSANAVNDELLRTGKSHGKPNVYKEVDALLELGFFVVAGEKPRTYQTAPGAKGRVT